MALIVQKYGGTSVADTERIRSVAKRVLDQKRAGHDLVVVLSARAGDTDSLLKLGHQMSPNPDPRELDVLLATGEQITVALFSMAVKDLGYQAVSMTGYQAGIITDHAYGRARINWIETLPIRECLAEGKIVVVAGFQGYLCAECAGERHGAGQVLLRQRGRHRGTRVRPMQLTNSPGARRQAGATLMEGMISLALSLVVTTAMVTLMGNSMGSATRIIEMSQLTDELRNAMSMMTRDVRRANYSANAIYCYANADCDAGATYVFETTPEGECLRFGLDRNSNGALDDDSPGAFRRAGGVIEMWVGEDVVPDGCVGGAGWQEITDPGFVNITTFQVVEGEDQGTDSFVQPLLQGSGTITQRTREVRLLVEGELLFDDRITRRVAVIGFNAV